MIYGVVLAAGSGTRIGLPKALLRTDRDNESFLQRASRVLLDGGVGRVLAVVSADHPLTALPAAATTTVIVNPDPSRGQLSSLQAALAAAGEEACDAIVMLPVDVPLVRASTVGAVIEVWRASRPSIVRPVRGGRHGHPVLFDGRVLDELRRADPRSSAKPVVRRHASPAGEVDVDDEGAFVDIDTVEDYLAAFGRLPERVVVR